MNYKFSKNMTKYYVISIIISAITFFSVSFNLYPEYAYIINAEGSEIKFAIVTLCSILLYSSSILFLINAYICGTNKKSKCKISYLAPKNTFEAITTLILFSIIPALSELMRIMSYAITAYPTVINLYILLYMTGAYSVYGLAILFIFITLYRLAKHLYKNSQVVTVIFAFTIASILFKISNYLFHIS